MVIISSYSIPSFRWLALHRTAHRHDSWDSPWLLMLSGIALGISFYSLYQAVDLQKWLTAKDEAAPNPRAGLGWAWMIAIAMMSCSFLYWSHRHPLYGGTNVFHWLFSNQPSELAAGLFLASIFPSVVAIFKFATLGLDRCDNSESPPLSRFPASILVGVVLSCISLSGSIAGLIRFFFWLKEL